MLNSANSALKPFNAIFFYKESVYVIGKYVIHLNSMKFCNILVFFCSSRLPVLCTFCWLNLQYFSNTIIHSIIYVMPTHTKISCNEKGGSDQVEVISVTVS